MFNSNALKYMNYQFGDKVDEKHIYAGIYNNNILLVNDQTLYFGFDKPLLHKSFFKFNPTVNELKYFYHKLKQESIDKWFTPVGVTINDFLNVDNVYYMPKPLYYVILIKRIPLG